MFNPFKPKRIYEQTQEEQDAKQTGGPSEVDFLKLIQTRVANASVVRDMRGKEWKKSIKAVNNEHHDGSKYLSRKFRSRSRIFKPKSRTVWQKKLSDVQDAMFSTVDYVHIESESDDMLMKAGASVLKNIMNIYLDKAGTTAGFNWYKTAMGAASDAIVLGVCFAKQFWKYEYSDVEKTITGENGEQRTVIHRHVTADHPVVQLISPEEVLLDISASSEDPIQSAMWVSIGFPLPVEDILAICERSNEGPGQWKRETTRNMLEKSGEYNSENRDIRDARSKSGRDRFENYFDEKGGICWLRENFIRIGAVDYHFWSVGTMHYLSDPVPTAQVYPEQSGKRPLVMGYGALEPHTIYPKSIIEAIQPLQQEVNEVTNQALDAQKISNKPVTKVRNGRQVNLRQVQDRTAESVIQVNSLDDIEFDKPPPPDYSIYKNLDILGVDIDDLAGIFATGTVANNRQLGETVGGMNMMSQFANKQSSLFIGTFMETFTEPVLRQVMNMIQYFPIDERIVALAGRKAEIWRHYQTGVITQQMLSADITVRVDYGNGSQDPMHRMGRLVQAVGALGNLLGPHLFAALNIEELVKVIMGAAGDKDGSKFINSEILQVIQQQMIGSIGKDPEAEKEQMRLKSQEQNKLIDSQTKMQAAELEASVQLKLEEIKLEFEKNKTIYEKRTDVMKIVAELIKALEKNETDMNKAKDNGKKESKTDDSSKKSS